MALIRRSSQTRSPTAPTSRAATQRALAALEDVALEEIGNAEKVKIGGLVQLTVRMRPAQKARMGRNLATGEEIQIAAAGLGRAGRPCTVQGEGRAALRRRPSASWARGPAPSSAAVGYIVGDRDRRRRRRPPDTRSRARSDRPGPRRATSRRTSRDRCRGHLARRPPRSASTSGTASTILCGDPRPVISDSDLEHRPSPRHEDVDRVGRLRELDRVRDQIRDHLPMTLLIAERQRQPLVDRNVKPLGAVANAEVLDRASHLAGEVERRELIAELVRLDQRQLKTFFDEPREIPAVRRIASRLSSFTLQAVRPPVAKRRRKPAITASGVRMSCVMSARNSFFNASRRWSRLIALACCSAISKYRMALPIEQHRREQPHESGASRGPAGSRRRGQPRLVLPGATGSRRTTQLPPPRARDLRQIAAHPCSLRRRDPRLLRPVPTRFRRPAQARRE